MARLKAPASAPITSQLPPTTTTSSTALPALQAVAARPRRAQRRPTKQVSYELANHAKAYLEAGQCTSLDIILGKHTDDCSRCKRLWPIIQPARCGDQHLHARTTLRWLPRTARLHCFCLLLGRRPKIHNKGTVKRCDKRRRRRSTVPAMHAHYHRRPRIPHHTQGFCFPRRAQ